MINLATYHKIPVAMPGKCTACGTLGSMFAADASGENKLCYQCCAKLALAELDALVKPLKMVKKPATFSEKEGMYPEDLRCCKCGKKANQRVGDVGVCNEHLGDMRMAIANDNKRWTLNETVQTTGYDGGEVK